MALIKSLPTFLGKPEYKLIARALGFKLRNLYQYPNPANFFRFCGPTNNPFSKSVSETDSVSLRANRLFVKASKKYGEASILSAATWQDNPYQTAVNLSELLLKTGFSSTKGKAFLLYFELRCMESQTLNASINVMFQILWDFRLKLAPKKNTQKKSSIKK